MTDERTRLWGFRRVATRYLNPITRPFAGWLPGFAILTHVGRTTGRTYRTPINVFRRGDDYVFFLTYGPEVQWVKNVVSSGRATLHTRGRDVNLVDPLLIEDRERLLAPAIVRLVGRAIGATHFVRMRAA
ncbi:MAG TPA: nitroreductase family deazaflavin-dependent oxidoreductase [Actinomycetota bacterium]|nr:nitroreductase family deazaflavin-dependent oxidoreductase [Actinomycetota bacterium]